MNGKPKEGLSIKIGQPGKVNNEGVYKNYCSL
jgi:hypothetical protein